MDESRRQGDLIWDGLRVISQPLLGGEPTISKRLIGGGIRKPVGGI